MAPGDARVLVLALAARGHGPDDGVLARELATAWAARLSAAGVDASAAIDQVSVGDSDDGAVAEKGFAVADEPPADDELLEAGARAGATLVLGGSVGVASPTCASLSVRALSIPGGQAALRHEVEGGDAEAWLQTARDVLTSLYDLGGVPRGRRTALLERGVGLGGFVAIARAQDLARARGLGHDVDPEALLAAWTRAARAAPAASGARKVAVGLAVEMGLGDAKRRGAARAALDALVASDAADVAAPLAAGELAFADGDLTRAHALALQVLLREPSNRPAHALAGRVGARHGDDARAQQHFDRYVASALPDERRGADLDVAHWWLAAGRPAPALERYLELSRLASTDPAAALGIAESLAALGRLDEALDAAKIAVLYAQRVGGPAHARAQSLLTLLEPPESTPVR